MLLPIVFHFKQIRSYLGHFPDSLATGERHWTVEMLHALDRAQMSELMLNTRHLSLRKVVSVGAPQQALRIGPELKMGDLTQ